MFTEAILDRRFAALPRLIRDATNPNAAAEDVRRFMEELLQADPALFDGALQFLSREGHGFVLVRTTGGPLNDSRAWPRWPLKRLFSTRRPSLITNPATGQRAFAVPFSIGTERHVVVAPLSVPTLDNVQQTFLDALQSVRVSARSDTPATERIPRFVWLGSNGQLAERIGLLLKRRGWPLLSVPTFGHVLLMLEQDRADVTLLEASTLDGELSSLRALRHAAKIGDAPIVYITDGEPDSEIETLVDSVLAEDASEGELLRALKSASSKISRMRAQALQANVERVDERLRTCGEFSELAEVCAHAALTLGPDAVSVMLADPSGVVHAAHLPSNTVLGDHWPTPFVTGETITRTYIDDEFYNEVFDDADYARRVRELHAVSAAALPIANGPQIVGSLLVFSKTQPLFQPEFDALIDLCDRTGRAASLLREPRLRRGPWQSVVVGDAVLEVFEGEQARASICVRSNLGNAAIVALECEDEQRAAAIAEVLLVEPRSDLRALVQELLDESRGVFLAVVENQERLRFACQGLPVPLRVPLSGPVPATHFAQTCETGTMPLDSDSLTLVYSSEFAMQIATGDLVRVVQRGLRFSRATLARSLPGLATSARKVAFACITMLSSDVDSPRPPALV